LEYFLATAAHKTNPIGTMKNNKELLEKLAACAAACQYCSDACLDETDMLEKMVPCIRLDRDCAEACQTAMNFVARNSEHAAAFIDICADLCAACAEECDKHDTQHCKDCAQACRECEEACNAAG
jgi:hypothetical protein